MTTKEELLKQRQLVDDKGRTIVTLRVGPNRAERRANAVKTKAKPKKTTKKRRVKPRKAKRKPKHIATRRRRKRQRRPQG